MLYPEVSKLPLWELRRVFYGRCHRCGYNLVITTSGHRSRRIHCRYDGEDLVGDFGMSENEGKGGRREESRSEGAEV